MGELMQRKLAFADAYVAEGAKLPELPSGSLR
jgi:hypothetical protein